MPSILVGIDGSVRGERALAWAARYAKRKGAALTLFSAADPAVARQAGVDVATLREASERTLEALRAKTADAFGIPVDVKSVTGKIVESIVEAAGGHDMVVMGSHNGASLSETIGGAKGLRVSVSIAMPTVVVPSDWDPDAPGEGVVVGVGPDQTSESAVEFGAAEALDLGQELTLVSSWAVPPMLAKATESASAKAADPGAKLQRALDSRAELLAKANPGLVARGRAVEGHSSAKVLVEASRGSRLLVLGTHSRTTLGRTLFGSVTHGVLLNLSAPTVVVPLS